MKYRIVKRGNKYVPQCRFLWLWRDFDADDTWYYFWFDTQEEAEEFIERDKEEQEDDIVVKVYE